MIGAVLAKAKLIFIIMIVVMIFVQRWKVVIQFIQKMEMLFEYPLSTGNCQNKKMTVSIFLVFMYKNNFINWIHLLIMGN